MSAVNTNYRGFLQKLQSHLFSKDEVNLLHACAGMWGQYDRDRSGAERVC